MIEQKNKYLQESTNLEHELETQTGNTHWKQNLKYELKMQGKRLSYVKCNQATLKRFLNFSSFTSDEVTHAYGEVMCLCGTSV